MTPRTVVHVEEVGSTSDLARSLVEAGEVELPLLVRADRQTAGRGRGSNRWWSDAGSLLFTLAVDPADHGLRVGHGPRIALAAAVAAIEAVASLGRPSPPTGIRWPNDVEAGGLKLVGILPEWARGPVGPMVLVGVGVNVATDLDAAPAEIRGMATSVSRLIGTAVEPEALLGAILDRVVADLDALGRDDGGLSRRWAGLDVLLGVPIRLDLGGSVVEGLGDGIGPDGGLAIRSVVGREVYYGGRVLR